MFITILLLPLISFLLIIMFGRFFGVYGSMIISCVNLFCSLIIAQLLFFYESHSFVTYIDLWTWIDINGLPINFSLKYDSLTAIMFIVVTLVSSIVHVYSCVYMYSDPCLTRFMSYLSLFTFFMFLLVSADNLLVLFMGWEGVGLCSYLLIGFWYTRVQAGKAATKAFIINKIGDLFLLLAITIIFMVFHTIEFSVLNSISFQISENLIELVALFLFIGAVGKSAQIGLHSWLPDAMEGPTPVSALIHAATMVTAGVFLIVRVSPILEHAPKILILIAIWGGLTAFISGTIGTVQNDIKKIIAYSTCSQLGYMILACGLSAYNVGFFHLFNHAFFKALLFLAAGSVIHLMNNEQDIRKMGSIAGLTPFVYVQVLIGSLALAGFPFLAGFYSKDIIIEISNVKYWVHGQFFYWLSIISAILTVYYSTRLLLLVFIKQFLGFKWYILNYLKVTKLEIYLLGFLGTLSIISGFYFKDLFIGFGSNYFNNSIYNITSTWSLVDLEFIPVFIKVIPLFLSIISFYIALLLNKKSINLTYVNTLETNFEMCKWYFNEILNNYLALPILISSRYIFEQYEKRILDNHGPIFFINLVKRTINSN